MTLSTELPRGQRTSPAPPRRARFTLADPLGALAILSVVAVVALWVMNQGGPLSLTSDRGTGSLGLLAGLLASDLMILQVVLLARIPWVERSWGHDLLTRRHRLIGFASFWLMTAHVSLFAVERSTREPTAIPAQRLRRDGQDRRRRRPHAPGSTSTSTSTPNASARPGDDTAGYGDHVGKPGESK
ncbi:ferric reductase-like transmembrane domain-containing protein [Streptomyces sp. NBC_00343]|uniref:ferric reductase-like transmembrane domain-containing protein n=1 Tax=Streptomyces sp. NBC_00343 TaxID=2975719 RepID=UPI002E2CC231|nr:ferric reductase-like transmembrane domain-containing protein [Streptomyces sp. NBC_00343]